MEDYKRCFESSGAKIVICPVCRHPDMRVMKDVLICLWCGHEQKQLKEFPEDQKFKDYKEMLE